MARLVAPMALTILTLGQIAHIAQRREVCPAQVSLRIVQHFAMGRQLVQILGMNYFQHVIHKQNYSIKHYK